MRRNVGVVWLEDNQREPSHLERVDFVTTSVAEKGYECQIRFVKNLAEAKIVLNDSRLRVDFFISDYNLDDNETGLDFLLEIRGKELYKQFFVLYSNNDYNQIKNDIIDKFKETRIELFSNFTFISLANYSTIEQNFERAIKISLSRWDELNAIRGMYMCEHAELEWKLRKRFSSTEEKRSYKELFRDLKDFTSPGYKKAHKDLFDKWEIEINYRNLLAHVSEEYDESKGYCIQSNIDKSVVIYETELDEKRVSMNDLKDKIEFLIKNPNRPMQKNNQDKKEIHTVK